MPLCRCVLAKDLEEKLADSGNVLRHHEDKGVGLVGIAFPLRRCKVLRARTAVVNTVPKRLTKAPLNTTVDGSVVSEGPRYAWSRVQWRPSRGTDENERKDTTGKEVP